MIPSGIGNIYLNVMAVTKWCESTGPSQSGLNPCEQFIPDTEGKHRCSICCKVYKRVQDLKAHKARTGHHHCKSQKVPCMSVTDAILRKRIKEQETMSKVKWGEEETTNPWRTKYLDSMFEAGGGCITDVKMRIAVVSQRFDKMWHIWADKRLHLNLRLRLYKSNVCSIMTYGSEVWQLSDEVSRALNDANAQMLSIITGNTPHKEVSKDSCTFDLLRWIRARRLQWLGHILRMRSERKLKQAVFELYSSPKPDDLLMDAPKTRSWRELKTYSEDKEYWKIRRTRVRCMWQRPVVTIDVGAHVEAGSWAPFTVSS